MRQGFRLYREHLDTKQWSTVCSSRGDMELLAKHLENSDHPWEKALCENLREDWVPQWEQKIKASPALCIRALTATAPTDGRA